MNTLNDITTWHKNFITQECDVYVLWDESNSVIITIVDTIEEAIECLDTYAKTLA